MIRLDLRLQIAAAIATVCIGIVTVFGVTLYMTSENMELALAEQLLSEELNFLIQHHRSNPDYTPAPGLNVQYYAVRTPADEIRMPPYLHGLSLGQHEIDIGHGKGDRHIAVRQVGDTRFIVVYDIGPYVNREREFKKLVLLSLLTVVGIALILGYWLAGILTRQLTQLAARVATFVPNEPHPPLVRDGQDREVAALAQALDQYQTRILDMIRREQEFTANASHELRTPLTAVRTSCELLAKDPALPEKARERVKYISQAADHMTAQIQALLFLAREQEPADREPVALCECVNDAAAPLRGEIARKGLEFEIEISPEAMIVTSRQALYLVLANLIKNAVHYTDRGFVRVNYVAGRLTVSDSGKGIPAEQLSRIFERNYRGENRVDGLGIGLDIVKRICDQAGWTIEVDSVPAAGSAFIITFR